MIKFFLRKRLFIAISMPSVYLLLCIPTILFFVSLYIRPTMVPDSGNGFLVFRSMLQGGGFNNLVTPDPANIANDLAVFQTWWSPGQYLFPGAFVWLGSDYGIALALTALISTIIGLIGWAQIARSFAVSPFVLLVFIFGLVTFRHSTIPFRIYNGGEVLLFAASPWCLNWLRSAIEKPPAVCFTISLLSAALLFLAKLTGLVVFAATVLTIVSMELMRQRRLSASSLGMLAASGVSAATFIIFWVGRGEVPASATGIALRPAKILFPISAAAFSGLSTNDLLNWLVLPPFDSINFYPYLVITCYVLGPLGLLMLFWIWRRLRDTAYRPMAVCFFGIIALFTAAIAAMYCLQAAVSYNERNFRFAGILTFLLLLVALEQWRALAGKGLMIIVVGAFALYGLGSYVYGERLLLQSHSYDPLSGISQESVPPRALEYLRSRIATHDWQLAIAVIPSPDAAIGLPGFRIISMNFLPMQRVAQTQWAGRAEKLFVILQDRMVDNGKAGVLLKSFVDYDLEKWNEVKIDGMIIYEQ